MQFPVLMGPEGDSNSLHRRGSGAVSVRARLFRLRPVCSSAARTGQG